MRRKKTKLERHQTREYRILDADGLAKLTREKVDAFVRGLKTGDEARNAAYNEKAEGWGYHILNSKGRECGVLTFNGMEVALYYKRHTVPVESAECDPFPQNALKDPKDVWVRFEFLHCRPSAERQAFFMDREKDLTNKCEAMASINAQRAKENELLYKKIIELEQSLEDQTQLAERYRQRLFGKAAKHSKGVK